MRPPDAAGRRRTPFLAEVRRRRLLRVALAYAIGTFAALKGAEVVVPLLELPRSVLTAAVVAAGVGLPLTLVAAWYLELGPAPGGRRIALPKLRKRTWAFIGLLVIAALALAGGRLWVVRHAPHRTLSVLIADFDNRTGEGVFDGTLEPVLSIAMEGASFITSRDRGSAKKLADELRLEGKGLGETRARLVAAREGIGVVVSGSIERAGGGYQVLVRAVDAFTGTLIAEKAERVSGKDGALESVTRLASRVATAVAEAGKASRPEAGEPGAAAR
jgi:hypothetical protein